MSYLPQPMNTLAHPPFDGVADLRKYVILRDDFVTGPGATTGAGALHSELVWTVTAVAGAAGSDVDTVSAAATVQGHPGCIQLNSGATTPAANDEGSLFLAHPDAIILPDGEEQGAVYVAAIVYFSSIASIEFNFGLFDALNAAGRGVNSVSAEFDASADAEWNLVVVDGSSATAVATDVAVAASTWYLLEILAHEHECQLFINGELKAYTRDEDIPDDEGLAAGFKVATETTAEKSVIIDAFMLRLPVDR